MMDRTSFAGDLCSWRRHPHQHSEFEFEELETARFVVEKLKSFGITEIA
jgi:metal-dependent amidase/aminoacylase/carboxypeptidase family protein